MTGLLTFRLLRRGTLPPAPAIPLWGLTSYLVDLFKKSNNYHQSVGDSCTHHEMSWIRATSVTAWWRMTPATICDGTRWQDEAILKNLGHLPLFENYCVVELVENCILITRRRCMRWWSTTKITRCVLPQQSIWVLLLHSFFISVIKIN